MKTPPLLSSVLLHFIFAVATASVLLGADYVFSVLEPTYRLILDVKNCLAFLLINFLTSYLPGKKIKLGFYFFVLLLSFAQTIHIKYFGNLISPYEFYVFFREAGEIYASLSSALDVIKIPALIFAVSAVLISAIVVVLDGRLKKSCAAAILIILSLVFAPLRAFLTENQFGKRPNPNVSTFYNAYGSLSYCLGKIIPAKIASPTPDSQSVFPVMKPLRDNPEANIVLIIGESVNLSHLSLHGYHRQTTPFLDKSRQRNNFVSKKALSGGVSTDVSLPLFFNSASGVNAVPKIISMNGCLFKMAAENNFKTWYFSAHPGDSMKGIYNYLCPKYIGQYQDAHTLKGGKDYFKAIYDKELITLLKTVDLSRNNFITLQIRASHSPYSEVYPEEFNFFQTSGVEDGRSEMIDEYDNSLRYVDSFIAEVVGYIEETSPKPAYVIFTGDHGEALGEEGRHGHLHLYEEQFTVPFFMYSLNAELKITEKIKKEKRYFSHLEISQLVGYLLGYYQSPLKPEKVVEVVGHDIEGSAGYIQIKTDGESIIEIKRR